MLSEDIARTRAKRFSFALGERSPGEDEIFSQIITGQEHALRETWAGEIGADVERRKFDLIRQVEAKRGGEPITLEEMRWVLDNADRKPVEPFDVFEQQYAKEFIDYVVSNTKQEDVEEFRGIIGELLREAPEVLDEAKKFTADALGTMTYARSKGEEWQQKVNDQSTGGFLIDMAKFMIPFYYDYKMRNHINDNEALRSFWTGNNLEQQADNILRMPPAQARQELDRITNELGEDNPMLAMMFAMTVAGRASSEQWLDNFFQGLDIAGIFSAVKPLAKGARASITAARMAKFGQKVSERGEEITNVLKEALKASADPAAPDTAKMKAAAGNTADSALSSVAQEILKRAAPIEQATEDSHLKALLSAFRTDIDNLRQGAGALAREGHVRLLDAAERDLSRIEEIVGTMRNVDRLTPQALEAALKVIQRDLAEQYRFADDHFIDIGRSITYNQAANVYDVTMTFGRGDGALFDFQEEAVLWAQMQGINLKDPSIKVVQAEQQGGKWYLSVTKPVRETDDLVREALINLDNETPISTLNTWIGLLRTPEETLAKFQRQNRHIATYAPQEFFQLMTDMAQEIAAVRRGALIETGGRRISTGLGGKKRARELERIIKLGRDINDPATGQRGYWFKDVGELESAYMQHIKRMPTEQEVRAYFAYVRLNEFDRVLRNLAVYRNKHRLGAEETRFKYMFNDDVVDTDWFDAIPIKEIPFGVEANLLVMNTTQGKGLLYKLDDFTKKSKVRKSLEQRVKNGEIRVLKVYDTDSKPMKEFAGSERVHYIAVEAGSTESRPLKFEQVPRRGGGHIEYDYNYYIKQARMRTEKIQNKARALYEGDITIMAIGTNAQGQKVVKHLNETLRLLKDDEKAARAYLEANTPIPWDEFKKWDLNPEEPVQVVPREKNIMDIDHTLAERYAGRGFRDASKDPHNPARMYGVQFTQERDSELFTIAEKGSRRNPLWNFEPAKVIDPMPMLNRAMGKIVHSRFLDDYKIQAIESWAQEAIRAGVLEETGREVNRNPYYHFYNPNWKKGAIGSDRYSALKTSQYQIQQLLGQRTEVDMKLDAFNQKLVDGIYNNLGARAAELTQTWLLPAQADPWKYLRKMAFHSKLGLFNWTQTLVQAQTFTHIMALAGPGMAMKGAAGSYFTRIAWMRNFDKNLIKNLDEKATRFGWKPGEFAESHENLVRSGFMHVMGEQAYIDDVMSPTLIKGAIGNFFDLGTVFFKEGERQVRMAAWHTAYREFRERTPTGRITDRMAKEILERADLLYGNMSRASSSQLHRGIFSVPTQFLTYQLRIMEQMLGKRLTNQEKMRAFGAYGLMYGFPTTVGLVGMPFAGSIRQAAIDRGVDLSEDWVNHAVFLGLPSLVIKLATGGTYNYGDRFGLQGFTTIREALLGDKEWWELVLGASGSVVADTIRQSEPLVWAMSSLFSDGGESFPLQTADIVEAGRAISSVNNGWRGWVGFNVNIWESRLGRNLTDVTSAEAIALTITGMHPYAVQEMHDKSMSLKDLKEMQKKASDLIIGEMRKGFREAGNKNHSVAKDYFKRAAAMWHASGMQPWQKADILSKAFDGYESMADTIDWNFIRNAPVEQYQPRLDALMKKQKAQRSE